MEKYIIVLQDVLTGSLEYQGQSLFSSKFYWYESSITFLTQFINAWQLYFILYRNSTLFQRKWCIFLTLHCLHCPFQVQLSVSLTQKNGDDIALCSFEQVLAQKSVLHQNQKFLKRKIEPDRINLK